MGLPNSSRETKFSGANGDSEKHIFPVQPTTSRIGNLTRLIHTLAMYDTVCDDHTVQVHAQSTEYSIIVYGSDRLGKSGSTVLFGRHELRFVPVISTISPSHDINRMVVCKVMFMFIGVRPDLYRGPLKQVTLRALVGTSPTENLQISKARHCTHIL